MQKNQQFWWKFHEVNLERFQPRTIERFLNRLSSRDPVFDAVCRLEEDAEYLLGAAAWDSTAPNMYWEISDFYASQWIMRKRLRDRAFYKKRAKAQGRVSRNGAAAQCTALVEGRRRCTRTARYVYRATTAKGNISYQRRCVICFERVQNPAKYSLISDGSPRF